MVSWGATPRDLDFHCYTSLSSSPVSQHCEAYYARKTCYDGSVGIAKLDVDITGVRQNEKHLDDKSAAF